MNLPFTNKFNLPEEVVNAIMKDRYSSEDDEDFDLSVTSLLNPIQQTVLLGRHRQDQVVRDVMDYYPSFLGSIAHQVLEEGWHQSMNSVVEQRLYLTIDGLKIGGKFDCYGNYEIRDYKSTKVWKLVKGDFSDWEKQLNIYAYFCDKNGYEVRSLKIIALLLNWAEHEKNRPNYPPAPIQIIKIPFWSYQRTEAYIQKRIRRLLKASTIDDRALALTYPCTNEEMWRDFKDYAAIKPGKTRAAKTFQSKEEVELWLSQDSKRSQIYQILDRYSDRKRCFRFCPVANHCAQHQSMCQQEGVQLAESKLLVF